MLTFTSAMLIDCIQFAIVEDADTFEAEENFGIRVTFGSVNATSTITIVNHNVMGTRK